mgnify:CR=1 FL=1
MAPRPDDVQPVEARGLLRLDTPEGHSLNLVADGDTLRLDLPGWREARAVAPGSFRGRKNALNLLAKGLTAHGLRLSVESAGKPVLLLGYETAPSWLARLLGLAPACIPMSAVRMLFR